MGQWTHQDQSIDPHNPYKNQARVLLCLQSQSLEGRTASRSWDKLAS